MVAQIDSAYFVARPSRSYSRLCSYALFEGRPLTTRGRWINPILMRAGRRVMSASQTEDVRQPVFILGTGRAGTTVLGKILSLHRDVGFLNEAKLLWHLACSAEDLNGNYTDDPAYYELNESDATDTVVSAMHKLYGAYLRFSRNARVLEKYPELIFRVPFVRAIFPDARFVFLVRNGYDTVRSIENWSVSHGQTDETGRQDWWGHNGRKWQLMVEQLVPANKLLAPHADRISAFTRHIDRAAVEWILTMQRGLQLLQSNVPIFRVDYDYLVQQPDTLIRDVMKFCDLSPDSTVISYGKKILRGKPGKQQVEIDPVLQAAFAETMDKLGY